MVFVVDVDDFDVLGVVVCYVDFFDVGVDDGVFFGQDYQFFVVCDVGQCDQFVGFVGYVEGDDVQVVVVFVWVVVYFGVFVEVVFVDGEQFVFFVVVGDEGYVDYFVVFVQVDVDYVLGGVVCVVYQCCFEVYCLIVFGCQYYVVVVLLDVYVDEFVIGLQVDGDQFC